MKVVVTGATGFVGRPLTKRLLDGGHQVTAWTRNPERARGTLPALCEVAAWDPGRPTDPELLRGVDAVIHLAGESVAGGRWSEERKAAIRDSRVEGTRSLVGGIERLPEAERPRALISASAIGYYGDRGDEVLDEGSSPGEGFLAEVCRAWEAEVARAAALGVRTATVRVGIVLGRDGGALQAMLPPFRLGLGGRVGSGRQWMSWVHLDDLVALFAFVAENPQVRGALNGTAPNPVTNADFTTALGHVLSRPTVLPVPATALKLLLGEMSAILLASQRVAPRATTSAGFTFHWTDIDAALADVTADPAHELVFEQWVPRRPEEVFPFFADAHNLEKITPDFLRFRVRDVTPKELGAGTVIDYKLSLRGLPIRWRSVIESWEPGRGFVDRQTRGPYRTWHHTHEFEPARGGTIIRDRVRYEVPLGALGEIVAGGLVRRDVERIFEFRRDKVTEMFGGADA